MTGRAGAPLVPFSRLSGRTAAQAALSDAAKRHGERLALRFGDDLFTSGIGRTKQRDGALFGQSRGGTWRSGRNDVLKPPRSSSFAVRIHKLGATVLMLSPAWKEPSSGIIGYYRTHSCGPGRCRTIDPPGAAFLDLGRRFGRSASAR